MMRTIQLRGLLWKLNDVNSLRWLHVYSIHFSNEDFSKDIPHHTDAYAKINVVNWGGRPWRHLHYGQIQITSLLNLGVIDSLIILNSSYNNDWSQSFNRELMSFFMKYLDIYLCPLFFHFHRLGWGERSAGFDIEMYVTTVVELADPIVYTAGTRALGIETLDCWFS